MKFKAIAYLLLGLALFWFGCYFQSTFDGPHWTRFPSFMTAIGAAMVCFVLAAVEAFQP
jgi:hypothetical protein